MKYKLLFIIILLAILLFINYYFDFEKKEKYKDIEEIKHIYQNIDYSTNLNDCNNLTISDNCVIESVVPKKEIICNNDYNIIKNDNITEIKSLDSLDK